MLIIAGGAIYTAGRAIYINNLPKNEVNEIPSQVIFNHSLPLRDAGENDSSNLNIPQEVGDISLQILS